jgi:hypothetical protein
MKKLLLITGIIGAFCPGSYSQEYIQIRQRALSEEITPDFSYSLSGDPTSVANKTLTDRPDALPYIWQVAGESDRVRIGEGVSTTSDGSPDGVIVKNKFISPTNAANQNFTAEQLPDSDIKTRVLPSQPNVNDELLLDGVDAPLMSGSDPEDGTYSGNTGTIHNPQGVVITSLPTNGELWYYGFGFPVVVSATDVTNGTLFLDPSLFSVVFTGSGYTSVVFEYAYVDAAGQKDPTPATYTISWGSPLPVKLMNFNARPEGGTAKLSWSSTEEVNSAYFEVQQSRDAETWTAVGSVAAQGQSRVRKDYNYSYISRESGLHYFRLKMVDKDGTFEMSKVRSAELGETKRGAVYPNPATDVFSLKDFDLSTVKTVKVFNATGVLAGEAAPSAQGIRLNLADGVYLIRVEKTTGISETFRLVVKK